MPNEKNTKLNPTEDIFVRDIFGTDTNMTIKGFVDAIDRVQEAD